MHFVHVTGAQHSKLIGAVIKKKDNLAIYGLGDINLVKSGPRVFFLILYIYLNNSDFPPRCLQGGGYPKSNDSEQQGMEWGSFRNLRQI
jgi:hypothetical protein